MSTPSPRARAFQLALVASAAIGLGACSKTDSNDVPPPNAAASMPSTVALAPASAPAPAPAVTPAPAPAPAPTVVAQNESRDNSAYEAGRRDQQRQDARRAEQQRLARERAQQRELPPRADRDTDVRRDQRVAAAACRECGVVESVTEVKVQGQTNGVGALAGGATGALVGNRIAGGNNRTLGGVVGAVGGGLIGNAIEKHHRQSIVYDVNVRMEDGSLRTVRESTAPAIGEKVRVESDGLHQRS
ncbi:MAG: glycine zipper 2TM domain-containing protein [Burkholderiales bacterium]|nr:glycine zipper 2TM domain-containing protein [Burkholderiales bacterium]